MIDFSETIALQQIPGKAISVRQPWAWAIIHAGKDIENRSWQAVSHLLNQRGEIALHASAFMGKGDYEEAAEFMGSIGVECPPAIDLPRGGIVGVVEIIDVVKESQSPWFFGPRGLVLANAAPRNFIPVNGCLGFFDWRQRQIEGVPKPARWMLPREPNLRPQQLPLL